MVDDYVLLLYGYCRLSGELSQGNGGMGRERMGWP